MPFKDGVDIAWRHANPVRIVRAEIGHDQIGRDLMGFLRRAAALLKQGGYFLCQRIAGNCVCHAYITSSTCQGPNALVP